MLYEQDKHDIIKNNRPKLLQIRQINGSESSSRSESDDESLVESYPKDKLFSYKYITSEELKSLSDHSSKTTLIVDIRNSRFYQILHIKGSVNYSCSSSLMCRRSIVKWSKSINITRFETIVVYDEIKIVESHNPLAFRLINAFRNTCEHVCILEDGFKQFCEQSGNYYLDESISQATLSLYCASPTHKQSSSADVHRATLSEIIPGFLYLGNEMDAKDKAALREHEITDIINVTSTVPQYFENKFLYYRLPASDSDKQNISQFFNEAYNIIENVKSRHGRVFIHCWAGVSRSVTIAMMYLIRSKHMDVLEALEYIKQRRSIADPNLNFLGQLSQIKLP